MEFRFNKIFYLLQKRNSPYYREAFYLQQLLIRKETLSELKFFDYQHTICKRIKRLLTFLAKVEMQVTRKRTFWQATDEILLELAYWGYYVWIIISFIAGTITLGGVTFFSSAYMSIQGTIHNLFMQMNKTLNDGLLLRNYYDVIKAADTDEVSGTNCISRIDTIRIKNLSFKYPGTETPILHNINLEIHKGERIAFIGENGSGKTTIIKLLLGLYPGFEGEILINGRELREYDIDQYRGLISVSFQDYKKFFFKIKSMIAMKEDGDIDASVLKEATVKSGAEQHVRSMPQGYDTKPGYFRDRPLDFSGGQWQKLALARMFYRRGQLRLLDEPTSSIDTESEIQLYRYFLDNPDDATTIAVTHRIDLLEQFDTIFVFHEGSIIEQGTYAELSQSGYLHKLIKRKEGLKILVK